MGGFENEIAQVGLLPVPRHVLVRTPYVIVIHGYSDASERDYACCGYLRFANMNYEIGLLIVCQVASHLKFLSLPRMELLGALILARLMSKCLHTLKLKIYICGQIPR